MKYVLIVLIAVFLYTPFSHAQARRDITVYDPLTAIHPFKLISLAIRPPIGLLNIFIKGGYYVLDAEPFRRAFLIDYDSTLRIDEDY